MVDALIKSLTPRKAPEARPAELDPSEFLAAAVRADQPRPSRAEAEHAVHTLLSYIGENPSREGLLDTPRRVVEERALARICSSSERARCPASLPPGWAPRT